MAGDTYPTDKLRIKKKVWLEFDGKNLFGEGGARLLSTIDETHSLTLAAERLGYSYKYAWSRLKKMHERTGVPIVDAHKGGTGGGGHVELTPWGKLILKIYKDAESEDLNAKNHR